MMMILTDSSPDKLDMSRSLNRPVIRPQYNAQPYQSYQCIYIYIKREREGERERED